jgi:hypothetical protein
VEYFLEEERGQLGVSYTERIKAINIWTGNFYLGGRIDAIAIVRELDLKQDGKGRYSSFCLPTKTFGCFIDASRQFYS